MIKSKKEEYKKPSYEFLFMDDLQLYQNFNYGFNSPISSICYGEDEFSNCSTDVNNNSTSKDLRWTYKPEDGGIYSRENAYNYLAGQRKFQLDELEIFSVNVLGG